jgi:hypothetical protein
MTHTKQEGRAIHDFGIGRQGVMFLLFWLVLNGIQVGMMELSSDEGYYWFYAQHLQWGYYDHPPMLAAMIQAGTSFLPGELGVRFFNVVFSTLGLALFLQLLPREWKGSRKSYLVLLSAPLLHYLTFLVFPDGPLLFFSLLFLVLYKQFLNKPSMSIAVLLGVSLALMAYSKYHGALVLLFTVLANPRLLKSGYFYLMLFVAGLLFLPHLWWQYQNDLPTLRYHLSGRTGNWSFRHVGEYISQQIFAIGPGLIFVPFVVRTKDVFERTLKFIIIGAFAFFLFSSFKTFVHFHWTSIALFPLLYFAIAYYQEPAKKKLFNYLLLPFVVLFFLARILLMFPIIPNMHVGEDYYHGRKQWAREIANIAGERQVFMPNNLREASLYSFYSGRQAVTLYTRREKKSQYELWGYEDSLQGKEVVFVSKYPFPQSRSLPNSLQQHLHYTVLPSFSSYYNGLSIEAGVTRLTTDSMEVSAAITNHRAEPVDFGKGLNGEPTSLIISFEKKKDVIQTAVLQVLTSADQIAPNGMITRMTKVSLKDLPAQEYTLFLGIRNGVLPDAILSEGVPFDLKR